MNTNLDIKQLKNLALSFLGKIKQYAAFSFIIMVLLIYSFLILRINVLTQSEPSDEAVDQKLQSAKRLKIDEESMRKIEELEDQNVAVQAIINEARKNPFKD